MGQEFLRNRCCLMSSRVSFAGFFLWGVIIIPFCWAFLDRYQHGGLALTSAIPFIGGFHGIPHFLAALIEVFEAFPISPSVTKGNSSRQRKLLATVVAVVFFVHSPKKPSQNRNSPGEKDLFFPILVRNGALGTKWTVFFFRSSRDVTLICKTKKSLVQLRSDWSRGASGRETRRSRGWSSFVSPFR